VASRVRAALALVLALGCGQPEPPAATPATTDPAVETVACPPGPLPSERAPGVTQEQETYGYWAAHLEGLDAPLLTDGDREALRVQAADLPAGPRDPWGEEITSDAILAEMRVRIAAMRRDLADGTSVEAEPGAVAEAERIAADAEPVDHARLVVGQTQMACTPTEIGVYHPPIDEAFDRNLCSTLHPGELVRVLAKGDRGRWLLVHAAHTIGWVREDGLSRRISEDDRLAWRTSVLAFPRREAVRTKGGTIVRFGVGLPVRARGDAETTVWVASDEGPREDAIATADVTIGPAPLTRAELFARAFAAIGEPYGWGGKDGARDCSQFLLDLFAGFGVPLARHSSIQARQGTDNVDVEGWSEADKRAAIDDAAARGVVLLYMPGHVMLHVGKIEDRHFAISAIAEYLVPCDRGGETLFRIDRVALTDLELGRGSSRGAFIERITRLAVFGPRP
jgi:hypothetical protein